MAISDELLAAPCIWCRYNGAGYWQRDTHAESCPWHGVGGAEDRRRRLPTLLPPVRETAQELIAARAALAKVEAAPVSYHGAEVYENADGTFTVCARARGEREQCVPICGQRVRLVPVEDDK